MTVILCCHEKDVYGEVDGKKLLNSGFPVNFCGDPAITDPPEFQLTRGLLVASIVQGLAGIDGPGRLVPLDRRLESLVKASYLRECDHARAIARHLSLARA